MAGIVNAVFFPVANQGFIIYPQQGAQSIPETFVDVFVIGLGALGVYLSYIAGRQTTRGRLVSTYLLLSLFLLFLAVVVGIYVFATK
jgi:nitrogen fixation/metabolism regulation signal transduction histidine kinase